jgi:hypothetical protein
MNTLIPRRREFYNRFRNTGTEQRLKTLIWEKENP